MNITKEEKKYCQNFHFKSFSALLINFNFYWIYLQIKGKLTLSIKGMYCCILLWGLRW